MKHLKLLTVLPLVTLLMLAGCAANKAGLPGYADGVDNTTPSNGLVPGQLPD